MSPCPAPPCPFLPCPVSSSDPTQRCSHSLVGSTRRSSDSSSSSCFKWWSIYAYACLTRTVGGWPRRRRDRWIWMTKPPVKSFSDSPRMGTLWKSYTVQAARALSQWESRWLLKVFFYCHWFSCLLPPPSFYLQFCNSCAALFFIVLYCICLCVQELCMDCTAKLMSHIGLL